MYFLFAGASKSKKKAPEFMVAQEAVPFDQVSHPQTLSSPTLLNKVSMNETKPSYPQTSNFSNLPVGNPNCRHRGNIQQNHALEQNRGTIQNQQTQQRPGIPIQMSQVLGQEQKQNLGKVVTNAEEGALSVTERQLLLSPDQVAHLQQLLKTGQALSSEKATKLLQQHVLLSQRSSNLYSTGPDSSKPSIVNKNQMFQPQQFSGNDYQNMSNGSDKYQQVPHQSQNHTEQQYQNRLQQKSEVPYQQQHLLNQAPNRNTDSPILFLSLPMSSVVLPTNGVANNRRYPSNSQTSNTHLSSSAQTSINPQTTSPRSSAWNDVNGVFGDHKPSALGQGSNNLSPQYMRPVSMQKYSQTEANGEKRLSATRAQVPVSEHRSLFASIQADLPQVTAPNFNNGLSTTSVLPASSQQMVSQFVNYSNSQYPVTTVISTTAGLPSVTNIMLNMTKSTSDGCVISQQPVVAQLPITTTAMSNNSSSACLPSVADFLAGQSLQGQMMAALPNPLSPNCGTNSGQPNIFENLASLYCTQLSSKEQQKKVRRQKPKKNLDEREARMNGMKYDNKYSECTKQSHSESSNSQNSYATATTMNMLNTVLANKQPKRRQKTCPEGKNKSGKTKQNYVGIQKSDDTTSTTNKTISKLADIESLKDEKAHLKAKNVKADRNAKRKPKNKKLMENQIPQIQSILLPSSQCNLYPHAATAKSICVDGIVPEIQNGINSFVSSGGITDSIKYGSDGVLNIKLENQPDIVADQLKDFKRKPRKRTKKPSGTENSLVEISSVSKGIPEADKPKVRKRTDSSQSRKQYSDYLPRPGCDCMLCKHQFSSPSNSHESSDDTSTSVQRLVSDLVNYVCHPYEIQEKAKKVLESGQIGLANGLTRSRLPIEASRLLGLNNNALKIFNIDTNVVVNVVREVVYKAAGGEQEQSENKNSSSESTAKNPQSDNNKVKTDCSSCSASSSLQKPHASGRVIIEAGSTTEAVTHIEQSVNKIETCQGQMVHQQVIAEEKSQTLPTVSSTSDSQKHQSMTTAKQRSDICFPVQDTLSRVEDHSIGSGISPEQDLKCLQQKTPCDPEYGYKDPRGLRELVNVPSELDFSPGVEMHNTALMNPGPIDKIPHEEKSASSECHDKGKTTEEKGRSHDDVHDDDGKHILIKDDNIQLSSELTTGSADFSMENDPKSLERGQTDYSGNILETLIETQQESVSSFTEEHQHQEADDNAVLKPTAVQVTDNVTQLLEQQKSSHDVVPAVQCAIKDDIFVENDNPVFSADKSSLLKRDLTESENQKVDEHHADEVFQEANVSEKVMLPMKDQPSVEDSKLEVGELMDLSQTASLIEGTTSEKDAVKGSASEVISRPQEAVLLKEHDHSEVEATTEVTGPAYESQKALLKEDEYTKAECPAEMFESITQHPEASSLRQGTFNETEGEEKESLQAISEQQTALVQEVSELAKQQDEEEVHKYDTASDGPPMVQTCKQAIEQNAVDKKKDEHTPAKDLEKDTHASEHSEKVSATYKSSFSDDDILAAQKSKVADVELNILSQASSKQRSYDVSTVEGEGNDFLKFYQADEQGEDNDNNIVTTDKEVKETHHHGETKLVKGDEKEDVTELFKQAVVNLSPVRNTQTKTLVSYADTSILETEPHIEQKSHEVVEGAKLLGEIFEQRKEEPVVEISEDKDKNVSDILLPYIAEPPGSNKMQEKKEEMRIQKEADEVADECTKNVKQEEEQQSLKYMTNINSNQDEIALDSKQFHIESEADGFVAGKSRDDSDAVKTDSPKSSMVTTHEVMESSEKCEGYELAHVNVEFLQETDTTEKAGDAVLLRDEGTAEIVVTEEAFVKAAAEDTEIEDKVPKIVANHTVAIDEETQHRDDDYQQIHTAQTDNVEFLEGTHKFTVKGELDVGQVTEEIPETCSQSSPRETIDVMQESIKKGHGIVEFGTPVTQIVKVTVELTQYDKENELEEKDQEKQEDEKRKDKLTPVSKQDQVFDSEPATEEDKMAGISVTLASGEVAQLPVFGEKSTGKSPAESEDSGPPLLESEEGFERDHREGATGSPPELTGDQQGDDEIANVLLEHEMVAKSEVTVCEPDAQGINAEDTQTDLEADPNTNNDFKEQSQSLASVHESKGTADSMKELMHTPGLQGQVQQDTISTVQPDIKSLDAAAEIEVPDEVQKDHHQAAETLMEVGQSEAQGGESICKPVSATIVDVVDRSGKKEDEVVEITHAAVLAEIVKQSFAQPGQTAGLGAVLPGLASAQKHKADVLKQSTVEIGESLPEHSTLPEVLTVPFIEQQHGGGTLTQLQMMAHHEHAELLLEDVEQDATAQYTQKMATDDDKPIVAETGDIIETHDVLAINESESHKEMSQTEDDETETTKKDTEGKEPEKIKELFPEAGGSHKHPAYAAGRKPIWHQLKEEDTSKAQSQPTTMSQILGSVVGAASTSQAPSGKSPVVLKLSYADFLKLKSKAIVLQSDPKTGAVRAVAGDQTIGSVTAVKPSPPREKQPVIAKRPQPKKVAAKAKSDEGATSKHVQLAHYGDERAAELFAADAQKDGNGGQPLRYSMQRMKGMSNVS